MTQFYISLSFLFCFFLLFDASSSSCYASKVVEIDAICNRTTDPSFCSKILNSKPGGSKGADLTSLAQYTIDITRGNIIKTIKLIKSLISKSAHAHDSLAKLHYEFCLTNFSNENDALGALGEIEDCEKMLKSKDYLDVNSAANGVRAFIADCISGAPGDTPYPDPSLLPKYARVSDQLAEIINVISSYLMQNN